MKKQKDLSDRALYYNSVEGMSYSDSMRQAQKDQNINQLTGNSSNTNGLSRSNSFVNSLRQGVKDPHKVLKEQTKQQKQQQIQKNQKREMENDDMERW